MGYWVLERKQGKEIMARKLPLWEQRIHKFESIFWDTHILDDLVEAVNKELPSSGSSEIPELEEWRKAQNLFYDIYNNGGANSIDLAGSNSKEQFGVGSSRAKQLRGSPQELENRTLKALETAAEFLGLEDELVAIQPS